jgi:hypothetical protein
MLSMFGFRMTDKRVSLLEMMDNQSFGTLTPAGSKLFNIPIRLEQVAQPLGEAAGHG